MAHIKVVRRSMRPEEWTQLRFGWLKRHIYSKKWEIKNLMIRDARQISEMNFDYYSDDYRPLNKGDMYFTPDGTAFIKADVDIPQDMQGEELWFSLKTAAEICVKINGKYVGGVDPNRERMLISPYISDKKTLHFDMMGYNRSKPDDERNPESLSVRGCRQIFEGAYICTVNHAVQDLVWDFELLLDIANSDLFNEDYRAFLNRELNNAMNFIDFDADELTGVDDAKKYIDENYSDEDLSLNTVAAEVNVSPNHLSAIFSQKTGHTFIRYLTDVRMNRAKELLKCTTMRSSEISEKVGYKDPHYFSHLFKKNQGCTPTQYREGGAKG